jgi:hypothetical protein
MELSAALKSIMHFDVMLTPTLVGTPRRGVLEVEAASLPLWLAPKSGLGSRFYFSSAPARHGAAPLPT